MPHANVKNTQRLEPARPACLRHPDARPASARSETRTAPAPADLGIGLVRVPEGAELQLEVQLEEVSEGVLVTATVPPR